MYLTYHSLFVTYFFPIKARDAQARGDESGRRSNANCSLCCNVLALSWWVVVIIGAVMLLLFYPWQLVCTTTYNTYTYTYYCYNVPIINI